MNTLRDRYGRGEFMIHDPQKARHPSGYRTTSGWRDWRDYCKRTKQVEIALSDKSLFENRAPKMANERLRSSMGKAVEQAIHKARQKPYFDKRAV